MPGEGERVRVVEDEGGREPQAGRLVEAVAQVDGGERVEAEVAEGVVGHDGVAGGVAEHGGGVALDEVQDRLVAFAVRERVQPPHEGRAVVLARGVRHRAPDLRVAMDEAAEQGLQVLPVGGAQRGDVEAYGHQRGGAVAERGVEEAQALLGRERGDAGAGHALQVAGGDLPGHASALGPKAPSEGGGGDTPGAQVLCVGVEEGVAGRVVALARSAQDAGDGGEQEEGGQVPVGGQLVEVDRGVDLGSQDAVQLGGGERGGDAVVEDARGVQNGGERILVRYPGQCRLQRLAVGGVAGGEVDVRAGGGDRVGEFGGARGVGAAAAEEQQPPYTVRGDQMPGDDAAEATGRAGEQDGTVRVQPGGERRGGGRVGVRGRHRLPDQPGYVHRPGTDRELRLPQRARGRQRPQRLGAVVHVGEQEAVRFLGLCGAQQPRYGGLRQAHERLAARQGHGSARQDDESRVGEPLLGQPLLGELQRVLGHRVHGGGHTGRRLVRRDHGHHVLRRCRLARLHRPGQVGQARAGHGVDAVRAQPVAHLVAVRRVLADDGPRSRRPGRGGVGGGRGRGPGPVDAEEVVDARALCGEAAAGVDRAGHERTDPRHGHAGVVGELYGHRVAASAPVPGQPYPQRPRARGVQRHVVPREGQHRCGLRTGVVLPEVSGLEGGVEQYRVQPEQPGLVALCLGYGDLGEHLVTAPPGAAQSAEGRSVPYVRRRELLVQSLEFTGVHRLSTRGRPLRQVELRGDARRREDTGGVPGPRHMVAAAHRRLRAGVGPGVEGEGTAARLVGGPDGQLQLDAARVRDEQRRLHGEFLDQRTADLVPGPHGQLHEGGRGQQHEPRHGVVGQPRVRAQRQASREQVPVPFGQRHGRTEQRVTRVVETGGRDVACHGACLEPVVVVLEGVGGQVDRLRAGEEGLPVQFGAVHVRFGERGHEAVGAAFVAAQGAQRGGGRVAGVVDGRLHRDRQHRVRAHLQEQGVSLGQQSPRRLLEEDRVAEVAVPVAGVHRLVQPCPGQRGEHRDVGRYRCHRRQGLGQPLLDGLHLYRVRGVVDRDGPRPDVIPLAVGDQLPQGVRLTADHHLRRTVHRGDIDTALPAADQLPNLPDRQRHRHHAALAGKRPDGLATQGHDPGGVLQGERTRHTRRGDLALTVTHHGRGPHTGRPPHLGQRHHHREQHRLDHIHPIEVLTTQLLEQIPLDERRQRCGTLTHPLREHRTGVEELDRHPRPLRPLPRKHEHRTHRILDGPPQHHGAGDRLTLGQPLQPRQQLGVVRGEHHAPVREPRPPGPQRPGDVRKSGIGPYMLPQPRRLPAQRLNRLAGHHERHHTGHHRPRRCLCLLRLLGRRLLQDHMGVGPAHAERRHAGPAWPVILRPLTGLGQQFDSPGRPVDFRRRLVHVQGPRQHTLPHRHHHLDDTGDTGRGLRVPDVRLQRPQPQRTPLSPLLPIRRDERLRLDRVTQRRTSPVRLHHVHITRRQPRVRQSGPDHPALRRPVGSRQPIARPVLIDGRTPHHRQHPMPVPPRIGQPLQKQQPDTLTPPGAVRRRGERLAPPVHRQPPLTTELHERLRGGHDRDAAGQGQVALALPQRLRGQMQGDQGRRARRVHRHGRAVQAQDVREAAGHDAGGVAGEQVSLDALGCLADSFAVALVAGSDEHPGAGAAQCRGVDAGSFDGLPGRLQQQPLLRVHGERLARGDTEEGGVELARVVQETALAGVEGAGALRVGVVEAVDVPAAVLGEVADGVASLGDEAPQVLGAADTAGVTAAHADDRDRLLGSRRELLVLPSQSLGLLQRRAQRFDDRVRGPRHFFGSTFRAASGNSGSSGCAGL
ncbi:hypothetical protein SALBM311S_04722 [Streptomyces alboniger]